MVGQDKKEQVLEGEVGAILDKTEFSSQDAVFLIQIGMPESAESYVLKNAEELNGDFYGGLLPLAEFMEKDGRPLCASVIYRALLDSILRRAQTKSYPHGVRYLRKLDRLAGSISDWRKIAPHDFYLGEIKVNHGRKSSFWSRYGKECG